MRKTMMMVMMLKTMMTMMTVATNGNDRRPLFVCFAAVIIPTVVKKAKNHKFFCEPRLDILLDILITGATIMLVSKHETAP